MKFSHIKITKKKTIHLSVNACIAKAKSSQTSSVPHAQKAQEFLLTFIFILYYDKPRQTRIFRIGIVGTKKNILEIQLAFISNIKMYLVPTYYRELKYNIGIACLLDHFLPCLPHQSQ